MKAIISGIFFILVMPLNSEAATRSSCGADSAFVTKESVHCLVHELIETSFPELLIAFQNGRIQISEFHSRQYFLKTSFLEGKTSSDTNRRFFSIDINPKIYPTGSASGDYPTLAAIRGILAHELVHLRDFEKDELGNLVKIGWHLGFCPRYYERETDEQAFKLGYANEIKEYRIWLYRQLSAKALKLKKKRYFTPAEIDSWIEVNSVSIQ